MNKWLGGLLVFAACLTAWGSGASGLLGEQARAAGKPLIADFGMNRCLQCIEQAKTMEELRASLDGRVLLRFVHVGEEEALAEAYKVLLIPTLVFFDADGTEVFRNVGRMKRDAMLAKVRELGLID